MKDLAIPAKLKILLLPVGCTLLLYSLLGFLIIPVVLCYQIPKLAQEKLNRDMQVENIKFNPFSMELNIHGFDVKNLDGSSFVNFKHLYVNLAVLQSITNFTLQMDQVILKQPYVLVKRDEQAKFNFTDLLSNEKQDSEKKQEDDELFPVIIPKIMISDGKLSWEDDFYSQFRQEDIYPLNLNVNNFTTLTNKQSQLGFSLKLASGGLLEWNGQLKLTPFSSQGQIKLDNVQFHKVWELFLQDFVNFKILKGSELIEAKYSLTDTSEGMQLLVNKAHIDLYDIQLSEKGNNKPLITIPDFKVSGISFDLQKKNIEITKVSAKDAVLKTWLNANGSVNYQTLFAAKSIKNKQQSQQRQTPNKEKSKPWNVTVNQLAMNNLAFNFVDKSLANPAHLNLTALNLNANSFTNKPGATFPIDLGLKFNDTGDLKIKGHVVLDPFSSQIKIDAKNISLKNFQPYIDKFARLNVISGLFNVNANISFLQKEDKALAIRVKGDSYINNFISRDQISNKDFLNWKRLSLNTIDLDLARNSHSIDKVKIEHPYTRVSIRKDKTINVNDIAVKAERKEKTTLKSNQIVNQKVDKDHKPIFKIAHFEMIGGVSDFSDKSLILPFSAHINHLKESVTGISSDKNAVIKTVLNGRVANLSPVIIKGKISPYLGNSEFKLDFKSMPLPLMTPYMAEFAGRKIEKGNMSLGLQYKVHNNKLTASNDLLIDQLVLGDEVENPDAVSLPLGLAIALLQDTDGKISLEVPITGNLDSPEFSVASVIMDALVNVITKIVSSPFYSIASLIGSDEDISKITFSPGETLLDDKQKAKLDVLVNALSNRPALNLEIKGTAFSENDWPHLQAEALDKQLLQIRANELNKNSDAKKILPEYLKQSDEENQRLLADLFIHQFPDIAERSLFGSPRLIDSKMGDFYQVARSKLSKLIPPDTQRLQKLAVVRAQTIAKYLLNKKIAVERVFLLDVAVDPEDTEHPMATNLSLTAD